MFCVVGNCNLINYIPLSYYFTSIYPNSVHQSSKTLNLQLYFIPDLVRGRTFDDLSAALTIPLAFRIEARRLETSWSSGLPSPFTFSTLSNFDAPHYVFHIYSSS